MASAMAPEPIKLRVVSVSMRLLLCSAYCRCILHDHARSPKMPARSARSSRLPRSRPRNRRSCPWRGDANRPQDSGRPGHRAGARSAAKTGRALPDRRRSGPSSSAPAVSEPGSAGCSRPHRAGRPDAKPYLLASPADIDFEQDRQGAPGLGAQTAQPTGELLAVHRCTIAAQGNTSAALRLCRWPIMCHSGDGRRAASSSLSTGVATSRSLAAASSTRFSPKTRRPADRLRRPVPAGCSCSPRPA